VHERQEATARTGRQALAGGPIRPPRCIGLERVGAGRRFGRTHALLREVRGPQRIADRLQRGLAWAMARAQAGCCERLVDGLRDAADGH
jgi:hypothetical protein